MLRELGISVPSPLLLTILFTEKLIFPYSNPAGGFPLTTMEFPAIFNWLVVMTFLVGAVGSYLSSVRLLLKLAETPMFCYQYSTPTGGNDYSNPNARNSQFSSAAE